MDENNGHGWQFTAKVIECGNECRHDNDHNDGNDDNCHNQDKDRIGQCLSDLLADLVAFLIVFLQCRKGMVNRTGQFSCPDCLDEQNRDLWAVFLKGICHSGSLGNILCGALQHLLQSLVTGLLCYHHDCLVYGNARAENDGKLRAHDTECLMINLRIDFPVQKIMHAALLYFCNRQDNRIFLLDTCHRSVFIHGIQHPGYLCAIP